MCDGNFAKVSVSVAEDEDFENKVRKSANESTTGMERSMPVVKGTETGKN
jgi:hypothetical protein